MIAGIRRLSAASPSIYAPQRIAKSEARAAEAKGEDFIRNAEIAARMNAGA